MNEDWRWESLETSPYLLNVHFIRKQYREYRPGWDHDHCVACCATLAEPGYTGENVVHEGYATTAEYVHGSDYAWACITCFEAFGDRMGWVDDTRLFSH